MLVTRKRFPCSYSTRGSGSERITERTAILCRCFMKDSVCPRVSIVARSRANELPYNRFLSSFRSSFQFFFHVPLSARGSFVSRNDLDPMANAPISFVANRSLIYREPNPFSIFCKIPLGISTCNLVIRPMMPRSGKRKRKSHANPLNLSATGNLGAETLLVNLEIGHLEARHAKSRCKRSSLFSFTDETFPHVSLFKAFKSSYSKAILTNESAVAYRHVDRSRGGGNCCVQSLAAQAESLYLIAMSFFYIYTCRDRRGT